MKDLWQLLVHRQSILSGVIALAAVLVFNNWVLGLWLNRQLLIKGGSVSDLSVHTQPHAVIFQSLDILAGLFFALYALLVRKLMPIMSKSRYVLIYGTLIFGLANVADGILSLPCADSIDKNCVVPIHINWSHFNFPSHGYSSVLIAICYFILPLAGVFYSRSAKNAWFFRLSLVALGIAMASFVSAIWQYFNLHGFSVKASGWAQGVQMAVMGAWFVSWYILVSAKSPTAKQVSEK